MSLITPSLGLQSRPSNVVYNDAPPQASGSGSHNGSAQIQGLNTASTDYESVFAAVSGESVAGETEGGTVAAADLREAGALITGVNGIVPTLQ